ncbi:MAG: hypothetical protein R2704_04320 [Microthrixaceae bacterium]
MVEAVAGADLELPVIVGGIIPDSDRETLRAAGVAAILTPGASDDEVVSAVRNAVSARTR